ncbi:unnamed protein product, partial [Penicillium salamii]
RKAKKTNNPPLYTRRLHGNPNKQIKWCLRRERATAVKSQSKLMSPQRYDVITEKHEAFMRRTDTLTSTLWVAQSTSSLHAHNGPLNFRNASLALETPSLCRIPGFVKTVLSEFDQLTAQLKQTALLKVSSCESRPQNLDRRMILLPEAAKRVLRSIEDDFVSKVEQFLRAEFKSS